MPPYHNFPRNLGNHYIILSVLSTLLFYQCRNRMKSSFYLIKKILDPRKASFTPVWPGARGTERGRISFEVPTNRTSLFPSKVGTSKRILPRSVPRAPAHFGVNPALYALFWCGSLGCPRAYLISDGL